MILERLKMFTICRGGVRLHIESTEKPCLGIHQLIRFHLVCTSIQYHRFQKLLTSTNCNKSFLEVYASLAIAGHRWPFHLHRNSAADLGLPQSLDKCCHVSATTCALVVAAWRLPSHRSTTCLSTPHEIAPVVNDSWQPMINIDYPLLHAINWLSKLTEDAGHARDWNEKKVALWAIWAQNLASVERSKTTPPCHRISTAQWHRTFGVDSPAEDMETAHSWLLNVDLTALGLAF